jgi:ribosomal protein S18 acetylase RimI-like enzyme
VGALLRDTWRRYGSQALDDQATLLQNGLSVVALARQEPVGFLGVTARSAAGAPPEVWADISLVAIDARCTVDKVLKPMLRQGLPVLQQAGCTGVLCLTALGWLRDGLLAADFVETDQVVSYVHSDMRRLPQAAEVAQLRPANMQDVDTILALNAAAFAPVWRYDDSTLMSWLLTAERAMLARFQGEMAGFALISHGAAGSFVHLSRVAIHPGAQGRGVGRQLVVDGLHYAYGAGAPGLALNTQASNMVSRRLYESLGFRLADPVMSVLVYEF